MRDDKGPLDKTPVRTSVIVIPRCRGLRLRAGPSGDRDPIGACPKESQLRSVRLSRSSTRIVRFVTDTCLAPLSVRGDRRNP
jgi:hypothetical protein